MVRNILLVAFRNFFRQPTNSLLNIAGLSVGFTCALLVLVWVTFERSFDRFHAGADNLFKVYSHVEAEGSFQTYDLASAALDVSSIPEAEESTSVSTGTRWPHVLC